MDIKFKEFISSYLKNESSEYPKLNGMKEGETKLENIYNNLLSSKKNNNKKKWSHYIENTINRNKNTKEKNKEIYSISKEEKNKRKKRKIRKTH